MPHWLDKLPKREQVEIMLWLFEHPGSTVRQYYTAKEFKENETHFADVTRWFTRLQRVGLIESKKMVGGLFHRPAVSPEQFHERIAKLIVDNLYDGDGSALKGAIERLSAKAKRKKSP